jgi:hypothetical protein
LVWLKRRERRVVVVGVDERRKRIGSRCVEYLCPPFGTESAAAKGEGGEWNIERG